MTRTLVTGASGFLGRELCRLLPDVVGIGRGEPPSDFKGEWLQVDLLDDSLDAAVASASPSRVFHLAGATVGAEDELRRANVVATERLLAALDPFVDAIVVVAGSSAEVAGAGPGPVGEGVALAPVTPYGAAKAEQLAVGARWAAAHDRRLVHARLFNLVGPSVPRTLAPGAFAAQVAAVEVGRARPVVTTGYLGGVRDYVDVRDAAAALILLAEDPGSTGVVNVCSGEGVSLRGVLDALIGQARVPLEVDDVDAASPADIPAQVGDPRRLRAAGWTPRYALEQSLTDLLDSYRAVAQTL